MQPVFERPQVPLNEPPGARHPGRSSKASRNGLLPHQGEERHGSEQCAEDNEQIERFVSIDARDWVHHGRASWMGLSARE
jgi:hypothetical protein